MTGSRTRERRPEVWGSRIPPKNKNFTGRDSLLEQLHEGISTSVTAVVPHALHGMAGVGKTQVAIEYAWRYQSEYELVWWISADQPLLVPSALAALAPHLNLPPAKAVGIDDTALAVLDCLRRGEPYERWLLIYDNADQPEDINHLVPRGPGHVLITSRNQAWRSVVETVPVDVFTNDESLEFLHKRVSAALPERDAQRLANELGHLPLALEQAGAMQAEAGMSVEEYLQLLGEQMAQILQDPKPLEYPRSMTAAWRLSVTQLQQQLPEAVDFLRCCAFFGPDPVPVDVFRGRFEVAIPGLHEVLTNPILRNKAIRAIGRFALAKLDPDTRTLQVHRLIQALLREDLAAEEQQGFREVVHILVANAAPKEPDEESSWGRYADLVHHIAPSRVAETRDPTVREFCLNMGRYLYRSGDRQTCRTFAENILTRWTADSGPEDHAVIKAQGLLGSVLRDLGNYREAYEVDSKALNLADRVLGPDDPTTLFILQGLGADLRARGDFAAAKDHDDTVRERHEALLGPTHPESLLAINNLALDYALISRYQEARALHEVAYTEQSNAGVARISVLISLCNLSRAARLCGDYEEACDLGDEANTLAVHEFGADHYWTLRSAKDLSIAQRRAGRSGEALELAQSVLDRSIRMFGENHPDTLAAAMNLANILRTTGQISAAFDLAVTTMERYPQVYGVDHPYNHGCAGNVALLHRVRGDAVSARDLNQRCLEGLDRMLGRKHAFSLTVALNLGSDLAALGDFEGAKTVIEDTLHHSAQLLGEEHPLSLGCAANLVAVLTRMGAFERADVMAEPTFRLYDRVLGPNHPDTVVAKERRPLDFDFDPPPI